MDASAIGGGAGVQIQPAPTGPSAPVERLPASGQPGEHATSQDTATTSGQTTSAAVDDLFAYKLSRPVTLARDESTAIPLFETELDARRVSLWLSREAGRGVQRALAVRNNSRLTLDQGAFSITENGIFGGEGVLPLLHPGEQRLAPYGRDDAVRVGAEEPRPQPPDATHHVEAADGSLTVHRTSFREHDYTVQNIASEPRRVVLGVSRSQSLPRQGPWLLSRQTPADEVIELPSDRLYRFHVDLTAGATTTFPVIETHTHPTHYKLAELSTADFENLLREAGAIPGLPDRSTHSWT